MKNAKLASRQELFILSLFLEEKLYPNEIASVLRLSLRRVLHTLIDFGVNPFETISDQRHKGSFARIC